MKEAQWEAPEDVVLAVHPALEDVVLVVHPAPEDVVLVFQEEEATKATKELAYNTDKS